MAFSSVRKAVNYLKRNGIEDTFYASIERLTTTEPYTFRQVSDEILEGQSGRGWRRKIKFSIVVPAYETRPEFMRALVDSVVAQSYQNWELVIADASTSDVVSDVVTSYGDARIRYYRLRDNGGISRNTNAGISKCTGDYIGLLDHDDMLTPDCLYEFAHKMERAIDKGIEYAFVYSDEDKCDTSGKKFYEPNFKPGFNLDLLLTNNYICHFFVAKAGIVKKLRMREKFDGAQDHDLVLRIFGATYDSPQSDIEYGYGHISKVLYHWRCHEESTASNPESKLYAYEAGRAAVADFLKSYGANADVMPTKHNGFFRIEYRDELVYPKNGPQLRRKIELTSTDRGAIAYNVFLNRYDIGCIGGPVITKNKITAGIMDNNKARLYDDLNIHYSGYMHRASLQQSGVGVDIRNMMLNADMADCVFMIYNKSQYVHLFKQDLIEELADKISSHTLNSPYIDVTALLSDTPGEDWDYVDASMEMCKRISYEGYLNYYDPKFV